MTIGKPNRRSFVKTTAAALGGVIVGAPLVARGAAKTVLKIATLAPDGSTWHKAFKEVAREVKARTEGAIDIKIYAGGVMGDEPAMIRKMRTGQLDGAAVTSVGLHDIDPQLLMLQLPLLFRNDDELDRVRDAMKDKFDALLLKAGFLKTGDGDVGATYLFSNTPIAEPSDVKGCKMWVWDSDPISKETMKVAGVNGVPLGVPDVLPSLQTGVIDAFANSPYGAIALQWYTKAKYVTNLKLSFTIGGSVLRAKTWDGLSEEHKTVMREVAEATHDKLLKRIRSDNKKAIGTLKEKGISVVEPTNMSAWLDLSVKVRENLTGKVFDKDLMAEMLKHLNA
jgi:TRAP-type C4-dicarboxylate transport system substrate-binding protein